MKKRIWELDAFRGLCLLGVIAVHFVYDVTTLYALADWHLPQAFLFVQKWGGVLFLLLSGICVTLGSHSVKRGGIVFACGMLCSAVTWGMYRFGMAEKGIIIYFGVLHCLGICMLLWSAFRRLPWYALAIVGAVLAGIGLYFGARPYSGHIALMPLGFPPAGFVSSDYFPLMPHLGFFLLGAALGKTLYHKQQTLFPNVNSKQPILHFLQLCGKHSLWIYLLHQPLLNGILLLISTLNQ